MADMLQDLYGLQYSPSFTIEGQQEADVNLSLPPAPSTLASVYGTVTDGAAPIAGVLSVAGAAVFTPLAGAKITLKGALGADVAATYTADDGEFVFYDVADGSYTLIATADGYLATAPMTVTILGGSIANVTMSMTVDERTYNGTVSGVIRDQNGAAVAGCFVGLYQLNAGTGSETLLATTKTNALGNYLFGGVSSGQYLVKAKLNG